MSFPPEVFLIGAQKAGTTTLAYLLDQHPRITVAQPKEPHFFTHNLNKGLGWYERRFPDSPANTGAVYIDASTSYAMAPITKDERGWQEDYEDVPSRIFLIRPDARFIYSLRDPVERAYSAYWHNVRTGIENREFGTALLNDPFYLDVGDYHGQLLPWLDYFPLRSFLFVLFEDIKGAPERVAKECCEFLGLDEIDISFRLDSAKNPSYQTSWIGRKMNRLARSKVLRTNPDLRATLKSAVPKSARNFLSNIKVGSTPVPAMKDEDRSFLVEYFRERNRDFEELIGVSLDRWQR